MSPPVAPHKILIPVVPCPDCMDAPAGADHVYEEAFETAVML
jgi:hypothetical protein